MADDPQGFSPLDLKRDILQCPEFALVRLAEFLLPEHSPSQSGNEIAQGVETLALAKFLVNVLHTERDVRHQSSPSNALGKRRLQVLKENIAAQQRHCRE